MSPADRTPAIAQQPPLDRSADAAGSTQRRDDLGIETAYVGPAGATEPQLTEIWTEVLGLDRVGVDDDFFELGGDSVGLTHVLMTIHKAWNVVIPIETFFDRPTVRQLAATIEAAADDRH